MDSRGANHGTLRDDVTYTTGLVDTAFRFDGIDDYIDIPSAATLQPRQALTIEEWVYAQGTPASQAGIAGTWDDLNGNQRTYLFWVYGGNLELLISADGAHIRGQRIRPSFRSISGFTSPALTMETPFTFIETERWSGRLLTPAARRQQSSADDWPDGQR